MSKDPLHDLVVSVRDVDRAKLAMLCKGRIGVDPKANKFIFMPGVREGSTVQQRVLLALLAQRVLNLLDEDLPMGLPPKALEKVTGASGGSIRPALMRLSREGLLQKDGDVYFVPSHSLEQIQAELGGLA